MRWPWNRREKKVNLVQYNPRSGVYFLSGMPSEARLRDFVQGYRFNDTVYDCVTAIIQAMLSCPWYVYRKVPDGKGGWKNEEEENHPFNKFMDSPGGATNPDLTWNDFLGQAGTYYLIAGESYIKKNIGTFGTYGEVEVLPSQCMTPKLKSKNKLEFEYRIAGMMFTFPRDEIIYTKTFNPEKPLRGLSPIEVIARQVDMARFAELWTISLLENEARPSGALVLPAGIILTDNQREKLRDEIRQRYQGYANAGNVPILEGGWDWKPFAIPPKEMELQASRRQITRAICATYKVAPELFGDNENKTYSNIKEARKALYHEAAIPLLEVFKTAFNRDLLPHFDQSGKYFLGYDISGIEALSEDLDSKWKRALDAKNSGLITRNEARELLGYGALPGEDVLTEPVSLVPTAVSELGKPEPEPEPEPGKMPQDASGKKPAAGDEDKPKKPAKALKTGKNGGFWIKPERKEAKWNAFARRIQAREKAIETMAKKYLREQTERISANVRKSPTINSITHWDIMNIEDEAKRYGELSYSWYADTFTKAVRSGLAAGKGEISDGEEKATIWKPEYEPMVRALIVESGTKIAESVMEKVMMMLDQAESENMTVEEFSRLIREELAIQEAYRARRIARTEAAKVENFGELEGYRETEFVELKGWLCAFVELSREDHKQADADYSDNPIPLDEPFILGGHDRLMHPLDGSLGAPAGQIINCLCTLYPQVKEL